MSNFCASGMTTAHLKLLLSNKGQLVCQVGGVMAVAEIPLRIHEVGRSLSGRPTIPPLGQRFSIQGGMALDAFSGRPDCISDISEFLTELDENPRLRASANLRTMTWVREHLERISESAAIGDPVERRLQDVLVLMNQLMARMR